MLVGVGFVEVVKRDTKYQDIVTLFETCGCGRYSRLDPHAFS